MSVSGFSTLKSLYAVGVHQEVCAMCRSDQRFRAVSLRSAVLIALFAAAAGALELRNSSTTEVSLAKANEVGVYSFLFLQPGTYSLKVAAAGFKPTARENIA